MVVEHLVVLNQQQLVPVVLALILNTLWMILAVGLALFVFARIYVRQRGTRSELALKLRAKASRLTVGFFHPYCNAGGGGERVLWCAINAIHQKYPDVYCIVYSGDIDASPDEILATARDRFNVIIDPERITFVFLHRRAWVEACHYPRLTMLLQTLGSLVLAWEAAVQVIPDVMLDTMGYAFTYPLFCHVAGCRVGCYVHYPTISTDMLAKVQRRETGFNNSDYVSQSSSLSAAKLIYYRAFAAAYGYVGAHAEVVMVNSTWTSNHIKALWPYASDRTQVVYPPCNTHAFGKLALRPRLPEIVSVAQFRPEKNHDLQLEAFARLLDDHPEYKGVVKLHMIGGCRNDGDRERVAGLKRRANELHLKEDLDVFFGLNVPYDELKHRLETATVGLHTMQDEHFGIGVVEFLAAGAIALAHRSAGPLFDIVGEGEARQGYLARTAEEYAAAMHAILSSPEVDRHALQVQARQSVTDKFSDNAFASEFLRCTQTLLRPARAS